MRLGDILYGPTGHYSTLKLPDHFVMLYIIIPQSMLYPRLINLQTLPMGTLTRQAAVNRQAQRDPAASARAPVPPQNLERLCVTEPALGPGFGSRFGKAPHIRQPAAGHAPGRPTDSRPLRWFRNNRN